MTERQPIFFFKGKYPTMTCVCCMIITRKVALSTGQSFHDFPLRIFCEKWLPTAETRFKVTREGICCSTRKTGEEKLSKKFNSWNTDFTLANQCWRAEQSSHSVINVFWFPKQFCFFQLQSFLCVVWGTVLLYSSNCECGMLHPGWPSLLYLALPSETRALQRTNRCTGQDKQDSPAEFVVLKRSIWKRGIDSEHLKSLRLAPWYSFWYAILTVSQK